MEELLDDNDVNDLATTTFKIELKKVSFWLRFSGVLLFVAALFSMMAILEEINFFVKYSNTEGLLAGFAVGLAVFLMFFLSVKHFTFAKKNNTYSISESEEALQEIAQQKKTHWRLISIIFLLVGIPSIILVSSIIYSDYSYKYNSVPEMPMEEDLPMEMPMEEAVAPIEEVEPPPPFNN